MARKSKPVTAATPKSPAEMSQAELEVYLNQVGKEIDRLLERKGCVLDVQPALTPDVNQPGTFKIGIMARILLKK